MMNIKRAKEEIRDSIEAYLLKDSFGEYVIPAVRQRPILLIGPPGIGKTQIMEQVAAECGIGLVAYTITHHTRQSAIGLPFISEKEFGGKKYTVTEYTMSEIVASVYEKMEATGWKEGILFIDEINCVSETLAPAMLQFLQYKTFGNHRIPEGWLIVAAGNPPEYNKSVREFDIVTMDRVKKIEVEADFAAWKEYAYRVNIHPAVISYLNLRQKNFYLMETTVDGRSFATPRGWEDVSRMLEVYDRLGKTMDYAVVSQYIQHEKAARDFANYLELYKKYQADYQIDAVLSGTIDPVLLKKTAHASFDERVSVVGLLLARLQDVFRRIAEEESYLEQLMKLLKQLQGDTAPPEEALQRVLAAFRREFDIRRENGMLTRFEERVGRRVAGQLEAYIRLQREERPETMEECFARLREDFAARTDQLSGLQDEGGEKLEHAFDFMEAAFGQSQEMAIFMTELNAGYYSLQFLTEYACERYDQYNRAFLFDENRAALLKRIDTLQQWG